MGQAVNRPKAAHLRLGLRGELLAAGMLRLRGFDILGHDIHFENAQIDLAARDGRTFVLVEVKTLRAGRRDLEHLSPEQNFSPEQQRRFRSAGFEMMRKFDHPDFPLRFDLVEVFMGRFGPVRMIHHVNFFEFRRSVMPD